MLRPQIDWAETLTAVGDLFPGPSEALVLKQHLVHPDVSESPSTLVRDLATASFLLTSPQAKPYEGISVDFAKLTEKLWNRGKKEVLSLLAQVVRQQELPATTTFATAVANALQPTDLRMITEGHPELIQFFLGHRPSLAAHVETWQLPQHVQWRIYEVLDALSLDQSDWGKIVTAIFIAATSVAVREAVGKAGPFAIEGALGWLESTVAQEYLSSQPWRTGAVRICRGSSSSSALFKTDPPVLSKSDPGILT